ncbi:DUF4352 domain-containing protein [Longispora sp. K20-0274]|uniref:DUF4352 domain-containing protein n=1 Tax=Longispora sp. K20-0274 TaxID=3088255 RepID=UPI00399ACDCA
MSTPGERTETRNWRYVVLLCGILTAFVASGLAIWLGGGIGDGTDDSPITPPAAYETEIPTSFLFGPGQPPGTPLPPVRDGALEFTVAPGRCGVVRIGQVEAKGEYCTVRVAIRNTGDTSRKLPLAAQFSVASDNVRYPMDAAALAAGAAENGRDNPWTADIKPGETRPGMLVFDVPRRSKLISLELHESPTSPGAKVTLN